MSNLIISSEFPIWWRISYAITFSKQDIFCSIPVNRLFFHNQVHSQDWYSRWMKLPMMWFQAYKYRCNNCYNNGIIFNQTLNYARLNASNIRGFYYRRMPSELKLTYLSSHWKQKSKCCLNWITVLYTFLSMSVSLWRNLHILMHKVVNYQMEINKGWQSCDGRFRLLSNRILINLVDNLF